MQTQVLTKYQFIMHLKASGNLSAFKTYIDGLAWDDDIKIEWTFRNDVSKDGALVGAIKTQLGLTDQQVDNFFVAAGSIQ